MHKQLSHPTISVPNRAVPLHAGEGFSPKHLPTSGSPWQTAGTATCYVSNWRVPQKKHQRTGHNIHFDKTGLEASHLHHKGKKYHWHFLLLIQIQPHFAAPGTTSVPNRHCEFINTHRSKLITTHSVPVKAHQGFKKVRDVTWGSKGKRSYFHQTLLLQMAGPAHTSALTNGRR